MPILMVPGGTDSKQGTIPAGSDSPGSTSVESPVLVNYFTQNVERLSSAPVP